jgi:hypothetical protein
MTGPWPRSCGHQHDTLNKCAGHSAASGAAPTHPLRNAASEGNDAQVAQRVLVKELANEYLHTQSRTQLKTHQCAVRFRTQCKKRSRGSHTGIEPAKVNP